MARSGNACRNRQVPDQTFLRSVRYCYNICRQDHLLNVYDMIRFIITIAFFLVVGLLGYNYFFGTDDEKAQAQEIFSKGAEVVGAGADLLQSEYHKYQEGKYDEALDNVSHLLSTIKEQGGEFLAEIDQWHQRKREWDEKKNDLNQLLADNPDAIDEEEVKKTIAVLEEERKILESEGKQLGDLNTP